MKAINTSIFILFFGLSLPTTVFAQKKTIDSLKNELSLHTKKDTVRVKILNDLAYFYFQKDSIKTLTYLEESEVLANTLNFTKGKGKSIYIKGLAQASQSNYDKAIFYFNEALLVYEKADFFAGVSECYAKMGLTSYYKSDFNNCIEYYKNAIKIDKKIGRTQSNAISLKYTGYAYFDLGNYEEALVYYTKALGLNIKYDYRQETSSCYNNIGSIYLKQANYPVALENYNKSLDISEKIKDTLGISKVLNNIGIIYKNYGNYDKAIENHEKSLNIQRKIGSKRNISKALNNLGNIYMRKQNYKIALNYYNQALIISKEINDKDNNLTYVNNIGRVYMLQKSNALARKYYEEGKKLAIEIGDQLGLCDTYLGIATSYVNQKKYKEALIYAEKSIKISTKLEALNFEQDAYELLSEIYENLGDYKKAFENHQQFKTLNDSLFNKESIEKIAQLEYEYKYKQAIDSANIRELKLTKEVSSINTHLEKSQRNIFLTIISFLVTAIILGGIIFFLKWRNIKEKNQNILIEQKLLRSQMTPHFIFNSLSVLQGMILNKEDKKAITYLSKFSKLLRIVLENSRDKIVPLIQELDAIDNYMVMQNLDTDLPYDYSLVVDENININLFQIPPMLIQPFIENAIEHAFDAQKEHREIVIHLKFINAKLICTIVDNGIGVNTKMQKPNANKKSLATTITSERLLMLSKEFKVPGGITITDRNKYNERGTLVTLVIPYKINEN
ncbi:tetratricopeptide repeat protein [Maribacter sp.]|uniref:tetratricopeptide repeat protein n=1 Tax=Maribacter sp. TaxID=1897614 RepID=UPI0025C35722|nr:tetratricopeptide repeat protein [Maribacter sp.]